MTNLVLNSDQPCCDWCYESLSSTEKEQADNLIMGSTTLPCYFCEYDGETPGVDMSLAQLRELMLV